MYTGNVYKIKKKSGIREADCGLDSVYKKRRRWENVSQDVFHIRMGKQDEDICEILESLKGPERSKLIKDAIRFYISYGEKLDKISQSVERILAIVSGGKAPDLPEGILAGNKKAEEEDREEQARLEKLVQESIMDILNM